MELTKRSMLTGEEHTMNLPLTEEEFSSLFHLWKHKGELIQDVFPMLSEEERNFVTMGITENEWRQIIENS